ncbi:hypothetical protein Ami103574_04505 [Aminipila butyrica]|uniref:Uncharacterized protein n=1 Tax=Aminipila butyrica TaxID=433296 RepID=A0A858BV20_9FIRM|nr:hypothetical protein [Aminipila butyrica]QIB68624.1 hypothetical protein Ami103574_04505 [Aminipila butyrica]
MKDGIIKGEGTSRLLKAPATIPTTFAEFRTALINGMLPIDLLYNAIGWDVEGTALNKANLLTDTVADALGLESDEPTVNEAINALLAVATSARNGLMSATDKVKLDGVEDEANNYSHPTSPGNRHIPTGGTVGQILQNTAGGTATWQDLEAVKTKVSEAVRTLYGLTVGDANVEKALQVSMNLINVLNSISYKYETFTSNSAFTVPAGVTSVYLVGCAAGADGNRVSRALAGEPCMFEKYTVTPGQSIPVTVGAGNTVFGVLRTLLAGSRDLSSNISFGSTILGLDGVRGVGTEATPPAKPVGFENVAAGGIFKLNYPHFFRGLDFKIGTALGGAGGTSVDRYPGYGGVFGMGGSVGGYSGFGGANAGGFGAGGGSVSAAGSATGKGSPGFLIVLY